MAIAKINTRLQLKNDIEENWNKATGFIPKKGEFIIYNPANGSHNNYRFKIGDDSTSVTMLPFATIDVKCLPNSNADAGEYGPASSTTLNFGSDFTIPKFTLDNKGRVINASNIVMSLPTLNIKNFSSTTETPFRLLFYNSSSEEVGLTSNDGLRVQVKNGTSSAEGYSFLMLGNNISKGTSNNKYGFIRLYSNGTYYHDIRPSTLTSNAIHLLPNTNGVILNTGNTSYSSSVTTGTKIGTLTINNESYNLYAPELTEDYLPLSGGTLTGNLSLGTHTVTAATFSGNATSASKLKTSRTISINGTAEDDTVSFNGSADVALNLPKILDGFTSITSTLFVGTLSGNASSASKIGSTTVGSTSKPVYLKLGVATECDLYAGGTSITLNKTNQASKTVSFYAPTTSGTSGQFLCSKGDGQAPVWQNISINQDYLPLTGGTLSGQLTINNGTSACLRLRGNASSATYSSIYGSTSNAIFYFPNASGTLVTHPTRGTSVGASNKPIYISNTGVATASNSTIGTNLKPVYMSNGVITEGTQFAGGTLIYLNGSTSGSSGTSTSFYAPVSSGTSGQMLYSNGEGTAPSWRAAPSIGEVTKIKYNGSKMSSSSALDSFFEQNYLKFGYFSSSPGVGFSDGSILSIPNSAYNNYGVQLAFEDEKITIMKIRGRDTNGWGSWYTIPTLSYTLPSTVGSANQVLTVNTSGNGLIWKTPSTPSVSISSVSWASGTTAGPTLSISLNSGDSKGSAIPIATASNSGVITTDAQTFAGNKTFKGNVIVSSTSEGHVGTSWGSNKSLYLFGNNASSSTSRGLYDTTRGNIINITSSWATFYGSATHLNDARSSSVHLKFIYSATEPTSSEKTNGLIWLKPVS